MEDVRKKMKSCGWRKMLDLLHDAGFPYQFLIEYLATVNHKNETEILAALLGKVPVVSNVVEAEPKWAGRISLTTNKKYRS